MLKITRRSAMTGALMLASPATSKDIDPAIAAIRKAKEAERLWRTVVDGLNRKGSEAGNLSQEEVSAWAFALENEALATVPTTAAGAFALLYYTTEIMELEPAPKEQVAAIRNAISALMGGGRHAGL